MKKLIIIIFELIAAACATAQPPSVDPIRDRLVLADNQVSFTATAFPTSGITWTLDPTSLGKGMTIAAGTGDFTWTPVSADFGSHQVTVTANDIGGSDSFTFIIQVGDLILDSIGDQSIDEELQLTFTASATVQGGTSGPPVYSLAHGGGAFPTGATIDASTGLFEWQTAESDGPGTYLVNVIATTTDPQTLAVSADSEIVSIEVFEVNAQHTIDLINNQKTPTDTQLAFTATAQDGDDPANVLTWSLDTTSTGKGMSINAATGEFTWTPINTDAGNHSVTVTAVDNDDPQRTDSTTFTIEVGIFVDYLAEPGMTKINAPNGQPLAAGNHVWLGTFPDDYNPSVHQAASWMVNWIAFSQTVIGSPSASLAPGEFSEMASGPNNLVSGKKAYWLIFQTTGVAAPAGDLHNVTAIGLYSASHSEWSFPIDGMMSNRRQLTSDQVNEAFGGASISGALMLRAYVPALPFEDWASAFGLVGGDAEPSTAPLDDDVPNLLKFGFNLDPTQTNQPDLTPGTGTAGLPDIRIVSQGEDQEILLFEFVRMRDSAVIYTPQKSSTLGSWESLDCVPTVTPINAEWERVICEELLVDEEAKQQFGRIVLTIP